MIDMELGEESLMKIMKAVYAKEELLIKILFLFYLIYLLLQHSYVDMYFDDYGYATLTYGWAGNTNGTDFGFLDLVRFLLWHYMNHGGRILAFFLEISIFRIGGLALIQIVQAMVTFFITLLTYRLLDHEIRKGSILLALLCITVYGTVSICVARDAVYWYSASIYYLWAFLPFLAALSLKKDFMSRRRKAAIAFLCFISAFSQEQMAVLFVSYFVLNAIFERRVSGKYGSYSKITVLFSSLGALIEIGAPGNFMRASVTQDNTASFLERIVYNLQDLCLHIGGIDNIIFIFVISISAFLALFQMYQYKKLFFPAVVFGGGTFILGYFLGIYTTVIALWLVIVFLIFVLYLKRQKKYSLIFLLIGGVISQCPMLLVDSRPYRTQFMLEMVFRLVCIYIIFCAVHERKFFTSLAGALVSLLGITNMLSILWGYYQNDMINQVNRGKLLEASAQVQNGEKVSPITLYRLKNDLYAGDMPYQSNDFMIYWIKNYYSLPQDTDIIWTSFGDKNIIYCINGEWYEDGWLGNAAVIGYSLDENQCLEIRAIASEQFSGNKIFIEHEGKTEEYLLRSGENIFYLNPENPEGYFRIYSEKTFFPSNGDMRELSVQLSVMPS